jgi:hypothetical protein
MVLSISSKREYIPKFNDNQKAPVADQVKVEHKAATLALKEKLFPKMYQFDQNGDVTGSFEIDRVKILKEFIVEIKNLYYKVEEDGDINARIRTADDLFKAPTEFDGLVDELYAYFQELLNKKVSEKN